MVNQVRCCPFYKNGGCMVASRLRLCKGGSELTGSCVTNPERCCGVVRMLNGVEAGLWETCALYQRWKGRV